MNFNYTFNILRYNSEETNAEVHQTLFEILDACFYGNDSLNLENFDSEYFHTNIVKRIDTTISDLCGFTSSLKTQIILNEKTCCMENWHPEYKDIYIPLCVPFEKYFTDDGFLDVARLPNIDTEKFIDIKFGEIKNYTSSDLKYSLVTGDLYTDWSRITTDQANRKKLVGTDDTDYTDQATRMFVAPVKVKMEYYYSGDSLISRTDNLIPLGFRIAPDNDNDESYNNFIIQIYNSNNELLKTFKNGSSSYQFSEYFNIYWQTRTDLYFSDEFRQFVRYDYTIKLTFTRTCGYYYLFNGFKKEILVHLFVNGMYEGFSTAKTGMKDNKYYDHYLEKLNSTYKINEQYINDETNYVDITYTQPRSYIYHSTPKS